MFCIRTVSQTKFPFPVCLRCYRIYHLCQKPFWGIVKRHKNTEGNILGKLRLFHDLCLFLCRKAGFPMLAHGSFLDHLTTQFSCNSSRTAQPPYTVLHPNHPVHHIPQRFCQFPDGIVFNPFQLKIQFFCQRLCLRQFCGQVCIFFLFFFIGQSVIFQKLRLVFLIGTAHNFSRFQQNVI